MITRRLLGTATCTASLLLAACGSKPEAADGAATPATKDAPIAVDSAQRARFIIEPVASASYAPSIVTTGTVAFSADLSTQVLAPISGPVSRILVQPGAHVEPGQAMATLVSPDFATALADYRKADAAWKNQKQITDLNEQLFQNDALARRELDQSRADLAGAAADRDAAIQALRALGIADPTIADSGGVDRPIEAAIRAPIAGTVVEKLITPGQLLESGTPTFTVADVRTVWVMANVFERDIRAVHRGDKALIATDASADTLVGRVDYVADLVDPATKATQVRLVVPNKGVDPQARHVGPGDHPLGHQPRGTPGAGVGRAPRRREPALPLHRHQRRDLCPAPGKRGRPGRRPLRDHRRPDRRRADRGRRRPLPPDHE